jgi:hypothetical protein
LTKVLAKIVSKSHHRSLVWLVYVGNIVHTHHALCTMTRNVSEKWPKCSKNDRVLGLTKDYFWLGWFYIFNYWIWCRQNVPKFCPCLD